MNKWKPRIAEVGELLLLGVAVYLLDVFGVLIYAIWRLAGRSMLYHSRSTNSDFRNELDKDRLRGTTSGF